ncbi:MAG: hypothetical protein DRP81_06655, partial [Candidatus Omnitrophota bacterium]
WRKSDGEIIIPFDLAPVISMLGEEIFKGYGGRYNLPQLIWREDFNLRREKKGDIYDEKYVERRESSIFDGGKLSENIKAQLKNPSLSVWQVGVGGEREFARDGKWSLILFLLISTTRWPVHNNNPTPHCFLSKDGGELQNLENLIISKDTPYYVKTQAIRKLKNLACQGDQRVYQVLENLVLSEIDLYIELIQALRELASHEFQNAYQVLENLIISDATSFIVKSQIIQELKELALQGYQSAYPSLKNLILSDAISDDEKLQMVQILTELALQGDQTAYQVLENLITSSLENERVRNVLYRNFSSQLQNLSPIGNINKIIKVLENLRRLVQQGSIQECFTPLIMPRFESYDEIRRILTVLANNIVRLSELSPFYVETLLNSLIIELNVDAINTNWGDIEVIYPLIWENRNRLIETVINNELPAYINRLVRVMISKLPREGTRSLESFATEEGSIRNLALIVENDIGMVGRQLYEGEFHDQIHNWPGRQNLTLVRSIINEFRQEGRRPPASLLELQEALEELYEPRPEQIEGQITIWRKRINQDNINRALLKEVNSLIDLLQLEAGPADAVAKRVTDIRRRLQEEIIYNVQVDRDSRIATYMFDIYLESIEFARYAQSLEGMETINEDNLIQAVELVNSLILSARLNRLWIDRIPSEIIREEGAVAKWQIWRFLQKIILIFQRLFVHRITKRAILQQRQEVELGIWDIQTLSEEIRKIGQMLTGVKVIDGQPKPVLREQIVHRLATRDRLLLDRVREMGLTQEEAPSELSNSLIRETSIFLLDNLLERFIPFLENRKFTIGFGEENSTDITLTGGKGSSLSELANLSGINVPQGFIVTTLSYDRFIEYNELIGLIRQLENLSDEWVKLELTKGHPLGLAEEKISDILQAQRHLQRQISTQGERIREAIQRGAIPSEVERAIRLRYRRFSEEIGEENPAVAVRSSATAEDLPSASFAGQQETYLNVEGEEKLINKIRECWVSLYGERVIDYRNTQRALMLKKEIEQSDITVEEALESSIFKHSMVKSAVVVQRMIASYAAGVGFDVDRTTGRPAIYIEASYGLGEAVVSGEVTPDSYVLNMNTLKITERTLGEKAKKMVLSDQGTEWVDTSEEERQRFSVSDEEVIKIATSIKTIGQYYHQKHGYRYIDTEFALDEQGTLYFLQVRPETVWANKEGSEVEQSVIFQSAKIIFRGGRTGFPGIVTGKVRIMDNPKGEIGQQDILVVKTTNINWTPLIREAIGLITEQGGVSSHAALMSSELGKPCIVGAANIKDILRKYEGKEITLDATHCLVYEGRFDGGNLKIEQEKIKELLLNSKIAPGLGIVRKMILKDYKRFISEMTKRFWGIKHDWESSESRTQ